MVETLCRAYLVLRCFQIICENIKITLNDENEMLVLVHSVGLGIDWRFRSSPSGVSIKRHTSIALSSGVNKNQGHFLYRSEVIILTFYDKSVSSGDIESYLHSIADRSWSSVCSSLTAEWYYFVFYFPSCPKTIFFSMTSSTQLLLTSENFYVFFFKLKLNIVEIT